MNFTPIDDRVLVKREEEATKTASGIYIPDSAKEKPQRGEVKAVSKKVEEIEVGDTVVFSKYGAVDLVLDGEDFIVLKTEDILGVIKK
ncbi:Co-chaperonin GroES [Thiovulum sp. ES]|jgi:chaperonin GroES|nr:Co-chaperonin GroES [Thiovulum sp. ES]